MQAKSRKRNKFPQSLKNIDFGEKIEFVMGDLVKGDFENEFVKTFTKASESYLGSLYGDGPQFRRDELGLVIDFVETPDSFYAGGYCKLLFQSGEIGWLPDRWLKRIKRLK